MGLEDILTRTQMKLLIAGVWVAIGICGYNIYQNYPNIKHSIIKNENRPESGKNIKKHFYASLGKPDLGYNQIYDEVDLSQIKLSRRGSYIGMIQRALRFQNITQAAEEKYYGIPKDILLGMACQESQADPTQPNGLGDSGLGFIHMQPQLSTHYGLKVIFDSRKLIDYEQGREINRLLKQENYDLKKLIKYDDRWHPIINIDAAARMIADTYSRTKNWNTALKRYSGRPAYQYGNKVLEFVNLLNDEDMLNKAKADFIKRNRNITLNGKQITLDDYIKIYQQQNYNYGLEEYQNSTKYNLN